jgi:NRAMP (natural resistance-associated macrophage protein)-like metal ion transporter
MLKYDQDQEKRSVFHPLGTLGRLLGPGVIAGAADDDPSGIATYSQAGAQFGYQQLWSVVLTFPFMVAIQLVAARIGRVTGKGVIANSRLIYPEIVVISLVTLIVIANTINIAADLAAMGAAITLVIGGPTPVYALMFGIFCALAEVFIPYRSYAHVLKWLTLVLFVYVLAVLTIHIEWIEAMNAILRPRFEVTTDYFLTVVAVFGTTISPYVFFWQTAQEVEDMQLARERPLIEQAEDNKHHLQRMAIDTGVGMAFSNGIAFCIMITTAATLHQAGMTNIATAAEAAEALRPLAGPLTFALFSLGIIGTGLLAVPVLAGSAGYAVAEAMHWRSSLELKPLRARGFYAVIAAATLIGAALGFTTIDPIKMLFWAAVINGFVSVPVMVAMMIMASRLQLMGKYKLGAGVAIAGWASTLLMAVAAGVLLWSIFA